SRRRHTRFSRDWSSDLCYSDLPFVWREVARSYLQVFHIVRSQPAVGRQKTVARSSPSTLLHSVPELKLNHLRTLTDDVGILQHEIGRASCRERVEIAMDIAVT